MDELASTSMISSVWITAELPPEIEAVKETMGLAMLVTPCSE